ncbi:hypothetical protein NLJ89_g414 [Agrocybe chaxingu]|uniref:G domain-containing protein n=1 Tax=Agrocybe chaxingu TaxID=84603 RepID=A0A9W8TF54_9AGAR|nr:hypothetical protein NLJ89_g414 [Agrocybe chaxingu]
MTVNPPASLPSTVEATLAVCPRFRILVTGVGKSSLVSSIFNVATKDIDIAHGHVGKANIAHEYTSDSNPRFILHDSQGFEPGSEKTWDTVKKFIRDKCEEGLEAKDRLHAIWLCIETPRTGSRLMQTGDEKLLELANELKVVVIIVFTKYDILFNEYLRKARNAKLPNARTGAKTNAEHHLDALIKNSPRPFEYVPVSTSEKYPERFDMLKRLTEITRKCLHGVEEYWINLGKSTAFKGHRLSDCLSRIHLDIIEVWNFYDPEQLLSGTSFRQEMVRLIEPLLTQTEPEPGFNMSEMLSNLSDLTSIASGVAGPFAPVISGAGIAVVAVKFLYQTYQAMPLTALCLGAYIVDLTLILHNVFIATLVKEPPRPLNWELVADTLQAYKDFESGTVHRLIRDIVSGTITVDPKEKIADLIRQQLKMDKE